MGFPDCPCLSSASPLYGPLVQRLTEEQLGADYGTQGCRPYDNGTREACRVEAEAPSWCNQSWCYVDRALCGTNATRCKSEGLILGSVAGEPAAAAACRSRPSVPSEVLGLDRACQVDALAAVHYSYATCGNLNFYLHGNAQGLAGMNLVIAVLEQDGKTRRSSAPSALRPQMQGYYGPMPDFVHDLLHLFQPPPNISITNKYSAAHIDPELVARYKSSLTACAHQVAIGQVDMCIGSFFVTPQRQNMVSMAAPIYNTRNYFVMPMLVVQPGIFEILVTPLRPYSIRAWLWILGFVLFASVVINVADPRNHEDFPYTPEAGARYHAARLCKSLFYGLMGLFSGVSNSAASAPAKVASVGFAIFILVFGATYTANLASLLVTRASTRGAAQDIHEAIDKGLRICIIASQEAEIASMYPNINLVTQRSAGQGPRTMHAGGCDGAILSEGLLSKMYSGDVHAKDCSLLAEGKLSEEEAQCRLDSSGQPDKSRDCMLRQVGDVLFVSQISFPVRTELAQSINWAITSSRKLRLYQKALERYPEIYTSHDGLCVQGGGGDGGDGEDGALPPEAMYGVMVISGSVMLVALCLSMAERCQGRSCVGIPGPKGAAEAGGSEPRADELELLRLQVAKLWEAAYGRAEPRRLEHL